MRWLVVWGAPPETTRSSLSAVMMAAQPPGPGLPVQAPSE